MSGKPPSCATGSGSTAAPERTLEEVGEKFGVTRERIRQIQNLALNKLRKMIEKLEAVQK